MENFVVNVGICDCKVLGITGVWLVIVLIIFSIWSFFPCTSLKTLSAELKST